MDKDQTIRLYASGPGLMIYSPPAVADFQAGGNYSEDLGGGPLYDRLVTTGRIVLLRTGSPQLDYALHFHCGVPDERMVAGARGRTRFGMRVEGDLICVRDGYDTLDWNADLPQGQAIHSTDGAYAVEAIWTPSDKYGLMVIDFFLEATANGVAGNGWVDLNYIA